MFFAVKTDQKVAVFCTFWGLPSCRKLFLLTRSSLTVTLDRWSSWQRRLLWSLPLVSSLNTVTWFNTNLTIFPCWNTCRRTMVAKQQKIYSSALEFFWGEIVPDNKSKQCAKVHNMVTLRGAWEQKKCTQKCSWKGKERHQGSKMVV